MSNDLERRRDCVMVGMGITNTSKVLYNQNKASYYPKWDNDEEKLKKKWTS